MANINNHKQYLNIIIKPTVGIDFVVTNIHHKGRQFRLQLWDTAGQ